MSDLIGDGPFKWPLISVVTPVRDAVDTLRETIESIITQDYPALEYIVVDGGSSDGSLEILYDHARHIDMLLHGRDQNLYDAVAKGFAAARGEVLAWLNADDMYEPGILRRVGRVFARNPRWQVVYFDGTVWKQGWRTPNRNQKPVGLPELMRGHILYQDSVFFRRGAYQAVNGLDRVRFKLAGDYDLWLRLAERFTLHYVPQSGSCFRIRSGQLSGDWNAYVREMDLARVEAANRHQAKAPPWPVRSFFARQRRKRVARTIDREKRFAYPLRDESLKWPEVLPQPLPSLAGCRCTICGEQPDRLLFSTPDTWYGDRRIWHVYYCTDCSATVVFPPPSTACCDELVRRALLPPSEPRTPSAREYKLFAIPRILEGNALYLRSARYFERFRDPASDLPRIRENRDDPVIAVGSDQGRMLEALTARGYTNAIGMEPNERWYAELVLRGLPVRHGELSSSVWPSGEVAAIVLNGTLEQFDSPLEALRSLRSSLRRDGRMYISTSNLDSIWLERYGPCWSRWHAPLHRALFTPRAIRQLADRAGYKVCSLKSSTPPEWLAHSDALGGEGLGAYVRPPEPEQIDSLHWQHALGAAALSALRWDWRLRGDCLHAVLVRRN